MATSWALVADVKPCRTLNPTPYPRLLLSAPGRTLALRFGFGHPPHALTLLRARREWPSRG
jgi:hypothetical protein